MLASTVGEHVSPTVHDRGDCRPRFSPPAPAVKSPSASPSYQVTCNCVSPPPFASAFTRHRRYDDLPGTAWLFSWRTTRTSPTLYATGVVALAAEFCPCVSDTITSASVAPGDDIRAGENTGETRCSAAESISPRLAARPASISLVSTFSWVVLPSFLRAVVAGFAERLRRMARFCSFWRRSSIVRDFRKVECQ